MKMVAASKLRGFQTRMEAARPMAAAVERTLENLPELSEDEKALQAANPTDADSELAGGPPLIIATASDRGLCGGVNSAVVRIVRRLTKEADNNNQIVVIGDKARTALGRTHGELFQLSVSEAFKKPPTFLIASLLSEEVCKLKYDDCTLVTNKFKTAIAYDTVEVGLGSPVDIMSRLPKLNETYEFEGDEREVMADFLDFRMGVTLFAAMLENATCEQSARMSAMDGATKNCGEMIDRLTTQMNRARQASITTELCEIVAGAEALVASGG